MLNQQEIIGLHEMIGGGKALSVYLAASEENPAERRGWRVRFEAMIRELEGSLQGADESEVEAFGRAVELLDQELSGFSGQIPGRGWVGFATPVRVLYAGTSAAPMPDLARWSEELHIAPYIRALKQSRPVIVALADQRRARIHRYQFGALEREAVLHASFAAEEDDARGSKRASTRSGLRGEPRTDAVQRAREISTQRLARELVEHLTRARDRDALLVLGGSLEMTASVQRQLADRSRDAALELSDINADATEAEIREAVDAAASEMSADLQEELVAQVIDATRSDGRACLGRERTERALQIGAVDTLLVSRTVGRNDPDLANRLFWTALEQGATVEEVANEAAAALDREGGIGARLRFAASW
jgi:hypothetical protein